MKSVSKSASAADRRQRRQLVRLLVEGGGLLPPAVVLARFPRSLRGAKPRGSPHTPWQILEHLRLAQWDLLRFSLDPEHESPPWPAGYWPPSAAPPDGQAWSRSAKAYLRDLEALRRIAADPRRDLSAPLPHAPGATLLGELYLAASHNSYHLGQLVLLRRLLEGARQRARR